MYNLILKEAKANLAEPVNFYQQVIGTSVLPDEGKLILNVQVSVDRCVSENRNDSVLSCGKTVLEIGLLYQFESKYQDAQWRNCLITYEIYHVCFKRDQ